MTAFYRQHIFVCENLRSNGERCCAASAPPLPDDVNTVKFLRQLLKAEGQHGKGRVRVNRAGCFDRCQQGPVLVIYPQGRWYRYTSADDLRDIIRQEVLNNTPLPRLQI